MAGWDPVLSRSRKLFAQLRGQCQGLPPVEARMAAECVRDLIAEVERLQGENFALVKDGLHALTDEQMRERFGDDYVNNSAQVGKAIADRIIAEDDLRKARETMLKVREAVSYELRHHPAQRDGVEAIFDANGITDES